MTYKYHADAQTIIPLNYSVIDVRTLVVIGEKDPNIKMANNLYKSLAHKENITYLKIKDFDHYVRKSKEAVSKTFSWLANLIETSI